MCCFTDPWSYNIIEVEWDIVNLMWGFIGRSKSKDKNWDNEEVHTLLLESKDKNDEIIRFFMLL